MSDVRAVTALDLSEVNRWYRDRGLPEIRPEDLPETGAIIPGVAAGFLYRTDSSLALLDGYITCREAPMRARHRAVHQITAYLIGQARRHGHRHVLALCKVPSIHRASQRHGLRPVGVYALTSGDL